MVEEAQSTLLDGYRAACSGVFGQPALALTRGEGMWVWDESGRAYLDLLGGIAVNVLGHAHPAVVKAVSKQAATLIHTSNFFTTPPAVRLAESLQTVLDAPAARVFFTNSGTESNEAALKIVKAWGNLHGKHRVIALKGAFHGRSIGALSLTSKAAYRDPFAPVLPHVEWIDATDLAALERLDSTVAGVFYECIQGEAGVVELDSQFQVQLVERARRVGALVVVDEIQTGMGRTGQWLAHQWVTRDRPDLLPDIVTLAKGLGGGMPIGATVTMNEAVGSVLQPGMHGTTFGGNPVCAAAANAVIETIRAEDLVAHARELGRYWRAELRALAAQLGIRQVRGRGLLIAVEFVEPLAAAVVRAAREAGFIINHTDAVTIRLAPALIASAEDADRFNRALGDIMAAARKEVN